LTTDTPLEITPEAPQRRLSKAQRRLQLLEVALAIVRKEGADRLTLGHLAMCAGVSKPVVYEHFGTRSGLLIALYQAMDVEQSNALREALTTGDRSLGDVVERLAAAYVHCAVDTDGVWQAVGAALAGSDEKGTVHQELLDGYVQLFATVLAAHSRLSRIDLERRCVGFIGAGEALSAAMLRGQCTEAEAAQTFAALMQGGLGAG
jgi:AcrR family transcriptional regulator